MKIGILTLPLHTNYGGILQAYALQTVLERMGHTVEVVNKSQIQQLPPKWFLVLLKRIIKKIVLRRKVRVFAESYHNKYYPIMSKNTQPFIEKNIKQRVVSSLRVIEKNDYDAIVVGSDQVWRPCCFRSMWKAPMNQAFLEFAKSWRVKRVAYAPSFGSDLWEYNSQETEKCKNLVKLFSVVSVREQSGVSLCKDYLNADAVVVPDPTMLLSKEDYVSLIESSNVSPSSGNLLCYVLDETPEKKDLIELVSKKKNLRPFRVNSKIEDTFAPVEERVQPPVEQWLRGFYDADFIVTDSFHACVFSIIFEKPFIVYGNASRGMARFESLLSLFGLEKNLITSLSDYKDDCGVKVTSLDVVNHFREKGLQTLKQGLQNNA